ncbi:hypothetical protein [Peribacillus frigoritolerans]|uniref:hypothetical protein n=1 Tax=Peribacillus frigoritolerans TaxID=450367 RepID=UPI0020792226|nr:hypothetical protein [Peribacillus frigoritolerans]USK67626.1 hypothetical protein LIT26_14075 [Peribacillus frigoritolerans]
MEEIIENLNLGPLIKHQASFHIIKGNPSIVKTLLYDDESNSSTMSPRTLDLQRFTE